MSKKKGKTDTTKQSQPESGSYKSAIYLALQGNDWQQHEQLLMTAIDQANEYGVPLYVVNQSGAPKNPPPCVPGMPNYPNCNG